jgi:predicted MFS family arabinose efflux permease
LNPLRRGLIALSVAVFSFQFANGINRSIQNNFYVETLGLQAEQMGILTTARELPGFLTALIAALAGGLTPPQLGSLSLVVMGIGYAGFGSVQTYAGLLGVAVVSSIGFHSWFPIASALGLSLASRENAGQVLGKIQAVGFAASLLSMALIIGVVQFLTRGPDATLGNEALYRGAFYASGIAVVLGAAGILFFPRGIAQKPKERLVFRRRYWLYYAITFLDGCRGEVFMAFGVYLLVRQYLVDVQTITGLLLVSSVLSMVLSQPVGKLIDRLGERTCLTISYSGHFATFVGFALIHDGTAAVAMYVVYNVLMLFSMSTNTYLKRTADPADVGPSLAMGMTTMHVSAMIVPILGGMLWERFGFQIPFLVGGGFALLSILVSRRMPKRTVAPDKVPVAVA